MAEVPVRRDQSPERRLLRRREYPRSGFFDPWESSLSPWSMMRRFSDEIDRMFAGERESGEPGMWLPSVDIRERDNNLVISADLPGLGKEDVTVEVTEEGLTIQGERKREHEEKREGYYRSERSYGTFRRVIQLPDGANPDQARAQFKDGVLEITVPIPESARRRREIPIETAPKTRTSGGGG